MDVFYGERVDHVAFVVGVEEGVWGEVECEACGRAETAVAPDVEVACCDEGGDCGVVGWAGGEVGGVCEADVYCVVWEEEIGFLPFDEEPDVTYGGCLGGVVEIDFDFEVGEDLSDVLRCFWGYGWGHGDNQTLCVLFGRT